ncbi:hypothetical protein H5410_013617 [Solanum commersonii]|uniref:Uncharacterized protein n=1 Tax=Solanum commersonii TaxID=4109 RepID=A0A9J5ZNQ8_SOLCO|nr:hypothetical protein H5410_013617 [Solanum commersonii]
MEQIRRIKKGRLAKYATLACVVSAVWLSRHMAGIICGTLKDDTIIFVAAEKKSIDLIMNTLKEYENQLGQKINRYKSYFYMFKKVGNALINEVEEATGFVRENSRAKHWIAWDDICLPKEERGFVGEQSEAMKFLGERKVERKAFVVSDLGGLGFRSLFDVSKVVFAKLWWKFRTTNSLWSQFMWNKYCKRNRPQVVEWRGGSQVWKLMLLARDNFDQEIWWEPRCGHASLWNENWTQLGALHYIMPIDQVANENLEEVNRLRLDEILNINLMTELLGKDICDHVNSISGHTQHVEERDKQWWMPNSKGNFSVKSAWDISEVGRILKMIYCLYGRRDYLSRYFF